MAWSPSEIAGYRGSIGEVVDTCGHGAGELFGGRQDRSCRRPRRSRVTASVPVAMRAVPAPPAVATLASVGSVAGDGPRTPRRYRNQGVCGHRQPHVAIDPTLTVAFLTLTMVWSDAGIRHQTRRSYWYPRPSLRRNVMKKLVLALTVVGFIFFSAAPVAMLLWRRS